MKQNLISFLKNISADSGWKRDVVGLYHGQSGIVDSGQSTIYLLYVYNCNNMNQFLHKIILVFLMYNLPFFVHVFQPL